MTKKIDLLTGSSLCGGRSSMPAAQVAGGPAVPSALERECSGGAWLPAAAAWPSADEEQPAKVSVLRIPNRMSS